ncbi:hypothetical protein ACFX1Q_015974 [Malus domestica]
MVAGHGRDKTPSCSRFRCFGPRGHGGKPKACGLVTQGAQRSWGLDFVAQEAQPEGWLCVPCVHKAPSRGLAGFDAGRERPWAAGPAKKPKSGRSLFSFLAQGWCDAPNPIPPFFFNSFRF